MSKALQHKDTTIAEGLSSAKIAASFVKYNVMIIILTASTTLATNKKSRRNAPYWYKLCCDRFNMLGENPSEEMMCSNPIYRESATALPDYEYIARNDGF